MEVYELSLVLVENIEYKYKPGDHAKTGIVEEKKNQVD
jgi:hypothetical protein